MKFSLLGAGVLIGATGMIKRIVRETARVGTGPAETETVTTADMNALVPDLIGGREAEAETEAAGHLGQGDRGRGTDEETEIQTEREGMEGILQTYKIVGRCRKLTYKFKYIIYYILEKTETLDRDTKTTNQPKTKSQVKWN